MSACPLDMLLALKDEDSGDTRPRSCYFLCCPEGICWLGFRITTPALGVLRGLLPQPAFPPGLMLSQAFNVSVCPTATRIVYLGICNLCKEKAVAARWQQRFFLSALNGGVPRNEGPDGGSGTGGLPVYRL